MNYNKHNVLLYFSFECHQNFESSSAYKCPLLMALELNFGFYNVKLNVLSQSSSSRFIQLLFPFLITLKNFSSFGRNFFFSHIWFHQILYDGNLKSCDLCTLWSAPILLNKSQLIFVCPLGARVFFLFIFFYFVWDWKIGKENSFSQTDYYLKGQGQRKFLSQVWKR